ncbi:MAG: PhoH family protein [Planctomycetes bacterium]|nr:PhoH family protein [Planctomycetota bacterium]
MSEPVLTLDFKDQDEAQALAGPRDRHFRVLRDRLGVEIVIRGLTLKVSGVDAKQAHSLLSDVLNELRKGVELLTDEVEGRLSDSLSGASEDQSTSGRLTRLEGFRLRTPGQRRYLEIMNEKELVFAIGPAGTGKTFLAVLKAVQELKAGRVQRIILCRPAVEAGESLGFLPGDFQAKVNPYMRPLYDSLYTVLDFETVKRYQEREVIEVAPLAYMRGRTLQDAFVILDEAQNTTKAQMKMFLTRMGDNSRIVVTGDVTQIDLPKGVTSGLVHADAILRRVKDIGFARLKAEDIVRHPLVGKVIKAYEGRAPRS